MLTRQVLPSATSTRLGTVWPATQFRLDATGSEVPAGHTVRKLDALVLVTVTFRTTAETPLIGTPARPVTCSVKVPPGPIGEDVPPVPSRVSSMRVGLSK